MPRKNRNWWKRKAHKLSQDYNTLYEEEQEAREKILQELLDAVGEGTFMLGPIHFHYVCHTQIGSHCFMNFNYPFEISPPSERCCWVLLKPRKPLKIRQFIHAKAL